MWEHFKAYQKKNCGQNRVRLGRNWKYSNLKLIEALFMDARWLFWLKVLKNITNFHLRPFALMFDHLEASQRQKYGQNEAKLRLKIAKKLFSKLIEGSFYWCKKIILIKTIDEHNKLSLKTILINDWSFWGFSEAKQCSK